MPSSEGYLSNALGSRWTKETKWKELKGTSEKPSLEIKFFWADAWKSILSKWDSNKTLRDRGASICS